VFFLLFREKLPKTKAGEFTASSINGLFLSFPPPRRRTSLLLGFLVLYLPPSVLPLPLSSVLSTPFSLAHFTSLLELVKQDV